MSIYLNVCRYSLTLDNSIEIQIVYSSGIWQFKYRFLSMMQEVQLIFTYSTLFLKSLDPLESYQLQNLGPFYSLLMWPVFIVQFNFEFLINDAA